MAIKWQILLINPRLFFIFLQIPGQIVVWFRKNVLINYDLINKKFFYHILQLGVGKSHQIFYVILGLPDRLCPEKLFLPFLVYDSANLYCPFILLNYCLMIHPYVNFTTPLSSATLSHTLIDYLFLNNQPIRLFSLFHALNVPFDFQFIQYSVILSISSFFTI